MGVPTPQCLKIPRAQYTLVLATASIVLGSGPRYRGERGDSLDLVAADVRSAAPRAIRARCGPRCRSCRRAAGPPQVCVRACPYTDQILYTYLLLCASTPVGAV